MCVIGTYERGVSHTILIVSVLLISSLVAPHSISSSWPRATEYLFSTYSCSYFQLCKTESSRLWTRVFFCYYFPYKYYWRTKWTRNAAIVICFCIPIKLEFNHCTRSTQHSLRCSNYAPIDSLLIAYPSSRSLCSQFMNAAKSHVISLLY